jgi:hypothetical protein
MPVLMRLFGDVVKLLDWLTSAARKRRFFDYSKIKKLTRQKSGDYGSPRKGEFGVRWESKFEPWSVRATRPPESAPWNSNEIAGNAMKTNFVAVGPGAATAFLKHPDNLRRD